MPSFFKTLRSKSSRRSDLSAPSITSDRGDDASNTDFGPRSPSSTTYGSVRGGSEKAKHAPSSYKGGKAATLPASVTSASLPAQGKDQSLMDAVNAVNPSTPAADTVTPFVRPSDLYAGRGVQWNAVKLAGPPTTQSTGGGMDKAEDMQSFLKARRQWKPTFITEEISDASPDFKPPEDLSKLTFSAAELPKSQGLKSLKDLEETHRRKQELLSERPLGSSLWDEPETSQAGSKHAGAASSSTTDGKNSAKKAERKVSNRSTSGSGRKLFGASSGSVHKKPVPVRTSSTAAAADFEASNGLAAGRDGPGIKAPPAAAAAASVAAVPESAPLERKAAEDNPGIKNDATSPSLGSNVRESMDTNQEGYATPKETSGPQSQDGHATVTNGNGNAHSDVAAAKGLNVDVTQAQIGNHAGDPTTPRASTTNAGVSETAEALARSDLTATTPTAAATQA